VDVNGKQVSILAILLLLGLAVTVVGCGGGDSASASSGDGGSSGSEPAPDGDEKNDADGESEEAKKEEAVPVEVAALEQGPIESVLRFSSNLETEREVQVFSQAKRLVRELLVEEGHTVRRGQILLRLQDDEQRSALAKVESQLAKAEREYGRQERLYEQELISEQAFLDATYELDQLRIALDDARRELSYTEVRAPIGGTVTSRLVNLGDQVQIGQHLFDVVDFESMVARLYVPEKYLGQLRTGLTARLSAESGEFGGYAGTVKRIAPVVDPRSGTVKLTVGVGRQAGLRPGMYVNVDLVVATHDDAVLVPKRALVYDNDQVFVYRLGDERRVERVFVEPLLTDKHNVEPVDGLTEGDQVVIAGQAGLKNGALVSLPGDEKDDEDSPDESDEDDSTERASL